MIKRRFFKFATVALMVAMTMTFTACGKGDKGNNQAIETEAEREASTSTDILAVEIVDKDGNRHLIEGVGVTDESGNTTITVTDKDGNTTIIKGEAATDSEGNKTVTNATVEQGGNLTTNNGTSIDTNGATVGGVTDNNDGSTATDVVVSPDKVIDVLEKQEQASREQASKEAAERESREQASKEAEKATENQTVASNEKETEGSKENATTAPAEKETQAPTQTPTTTPTQPATKPAETQAPTTAPTTAPTEAPTEDTSVKTEWGATVVSTSENKNMYIYVTSDGWEIANGKRDNSWAVNEYYGTEKNPTVPTIFMGNKLTTMGIRGNSYVETVVVPDQFVRATFSNCKSLKTLTLGKGITELPACMINYCYALKELNVKGTLTDIAQNFVDGGALGESYFSADVINFYQNPQTMKDFNGMTTNSEYLARINYLTHGANDFKKINFIY